MRLEHHLVGYVRYISPYIIIITSVNFPTLVITNVILNLPCK